MKCGKSIKKYMNIVLFAVIAFLLLPQTTSRADEYFTSGYSQKSFSDDDGFGSGEANCVCQSTSGYIWVGNDNGLYRYDGSEFTLFSLDSGEDGTKYSINCIYLTTEDKLYVGTDNYGLYLYDNGLFRRVPSTYNLGVSTVNAMYEDTRNRLWLATSSGIIYLSDGDAETIIDDRLSGLSIGNISGYNDTIYAVANNDYIIVIDDAGIITVDSKIKYKVEDINSIFVDEEGNRYYGTASYSILKIMTDGSYEIINRGSLHGINRIYSDGSRI